ncbi:MAG: HigA family addiction module antidote protein [Agitococcus sp.]|jgi:addiction module HigA family antidote|nr:HigA family addiction module antidote protein [Agitococcus sp.]
MSMMFNPAYPAEILREEILPTLGLTVTAAAKQLGVSRVTLSRLLHGVTGITPDMALRIEAWLGKERGGDAEHWLRMQSNYDLWQARQKTPAVVQRAPVESVNHVTVTA